ncbi:MAG TPA: flavoprotein [Elusimicrobiota bacterium]|nr:flavoprotein [Elusimicrobiota bacterium]
MKKPSLRKREIVLGVTGSIAAYKAAELARRFQDGGARVTCVMTATATKFIAPLTLSALTGRPAAQDMFDQKLWNMSHLSLAQTADAVVVAPCSANVIGKLAAGLADDLLTTLVLAAQVPVFIAPAMHKAMWDHPATRKNVETCRSYGYRFVGPVEGPLASGASGVGRMEEPSRIVETVAAALSTPAKRVRTS